MARRAEESGAGVIYGFAFEYTDGHVSLVTVPGHPENARVKADRDAEAERRKKLKLSTRGVLREATADELKKHKIEVPY